MHSNDNFLGIGLYSLAEAVRLTGVNYQTIARWTDGYSYNKSEDKRSINPVFERELPRVGENLYLSFLDLIEIKFVKAFRDEGVSWSNIKDAARKAAKEMKTSHPFSQVSFNTDGKRIFMEQQNNTLDLNKHQYVFKKVVEPTFKNELRFEGKSKQPTEWLPTLGRGKIVLDPKRSFGAPILKEEGIPTHAIYSAYLSEDESIDSVSKWFEIPKSSVRAAVDFEIQLAA